MKKILCILMALFLMASFSGCLKDDYEALETEIEDLEDDVDDAKDDMDKLISKLQELTETKLALEGERDGLIDESDNLDDEKSSLNDKIKKTSDDGIQITAAQFDLAFSGYTYDVEKSETLELFSLPYTQIIDGATVLIYYAYINGEVPGDFYFRLGLASDNVHIENIIFVADKDVANEYSDLFSNYAASLGIVYVMAKNESYFDIVKDKELDALYELKPAYNNTVKMSFDELTNYYTVTIEDIS